MDRGIPVLRHKVSCIVTKHGSSPIAVFMDPWGLKAPTASKIQISSEHKSPAQSHSINYIKITTFAHDDLTLAKIRQNSITIRLQKIQFKSKTEVCTVQYTND